MRFQKISIILLIIIGGLLISISQYACADSSLKALEEKVNALWEARLERDNAAIYDLADLDFQKKTEKKNFVKGPGLSPDSYKIKKVTLDDSGKKGWSTAAFDAVKMGQTFKNIQITEDWIYQEGQWRVAFSHERNPFEMKKSDMNEIKKSDMKKK